MCMQINNPQGRNCAERRERGAHASYPMKPNSLSRVPIKNRYLHGTVHSFILPQIRANTVLVRAGSYTLNA